MISLLTYPAGTLQGLFGSDEMIFHFANDEIKKPVHQWYLQRKGKDERWVGIVNYTSVSIMDCDRGKVWNEWDEQDQIMSLIVLVSTQADEIAQKTQNSNGGKKGKCLIQ